MWFIKKKPFKTSLPGQLPEAGALESHSPTWIFIESWAKEEMERLRAKNDNPAVTENQTAIIRGRIKTLKEILDLQKKKGLLT